MIKSAIAALQRRSSTIGRRNYSNNISTAVDSVVLRSLKEHYLELSKMSPPPKMSPPSPFAIVKGSLDGSGPALRRTYGNEEINVYVMRLANMDEEGDDEINQVFLRIQISKPNRGNSLYFLCGLYPDAVGIHSVSMIPKLDSEDFLTLPSKYNGPIFEDMEVRAKDAFHGYIEERGVNQSLFPFLQAWLYIKDHRSLMSWFKSVGTFITSTSNPSLTPS